MGFMQSLHCSCSILCVERFWIWADPEGAGVWTEPLGKLQVALGDQGFNLLLEGVS